MPRERAVRPVGGSPRSAPVGGGFAGLVEEVFGCVAEHHPLDAELVLAEVRRRAPLLAEAERRAVAGAVIARTEGYGPLAPFFRDGAVSEVMVNAGAVWVERCGGLERTDLTLTPPDVQRLIERIVGPAGARVDRASPIADVRLPDGSRANIVLPPLAPDGPCITIRRFLLHRARLADFGEPGVATLLGAAVRRRSNVVVSGGTGSGKTTLLNALAAHIGPTERVVTIEDTAELRLDHPHVVRLEAREANTEGVGAVSIRRLVHTALRMRPDRILVGEARGDEVMDVLQAMNSGHEGSMSTCHANTPRDALRRLEALALLGGDRLVLPFVQDQLRAALHLIVHVRRRPDGGRRISDVVALRRGADWAGGDGFEPVVIDGRLVPGAAELLGAAR